MLTDISEFILSFGRSNLFEYIIGANNIGTTSKGKSRRRLNNKAFLSSLLISRKKFNFQNSIQNNHHYSLVNCLWFYSI